MSCERKFTDDESERISRLSESLDLQGYLLTGAFETQVKPVCVSVTHCVCYPKAETFCRPTHDMINTAS